MTAALHIAHDGGGVDYGEATEKLENNGLAAFDASWRELGDQLRTALRRRPNGEESGE